LKPGKKEFIVDPPKGFYFDFKAFEALKYRDELKDYYRKFLEGRINKHNETIQNRKTDNTRNDGNWFNRLVNRLPF
jgi:hypothetical protein